MVPSLLCRDAMRNGYASRMPAGFTGDTALSGAAGQTPLRRNDTVAPADTPATPEALAPGLAEAPAT